ncbi:hypothetical protein ASPZODRAFT_13464 [Penicilliopsis zonata CBS 506.65]|uniref:Uncharacterized protein n=1 Tax=Penicilliopsis zonata CBS 506.65 TaxID=1073090 RepID=A0A1L9STE2_9EURO|nr:hypothetical protein ASPZODRAFT_13464 [Penicilliopsis zonata CBS 506.65]OJJ50381.1 hypothetical protein ASPZODRAFT_13464 [Penicilliopsis zonata CBS 506.65]
MKIEERVEESEGFDAVQHHRLRMLRCLPLSSKSKAFARNIITVEGNMRQNLRREEYLHELIQGLQEAQGCTPEDKTQLDKWEQEIQRRRRDYWTHTREWHQRESLCPPGPLKRGFDAWRATPNWYLHSDLRDYCAARVGCCGRSCGCCERRGEQATDQTRLAVGHCTVERGCCIRDCGFELTVEEKKEYHKAFGVSMDRPNNIFVERIVTLHILGISINE